MTEYTVEQAAKAIKDIDKQQRFAGAVALTRTAKAIQNEIGDQITEKFTLRRKHAISSVRIKPAQKEDLEAEVFTYAKYLDIHDMGGERKGDEFWIPGSDFERITGVDTQAKVIPKKYRRPAVLNKSFKSANSSKRVKPFRMKTRAGYDLVVVRIPSAKRNLSVLYYIQPNSITLEDREFWRKPSDEVYQRRFDKLYDEAWDKYVLRKS